MLDWRAFASAAGVGLVVLALAAVLPASAAATFPGRNGMVLALFDSATRATIEGIEPSGGGHVVYACTMDGDSCDFQIEFPSISPNGRELAFDGMIYTDSYYTQSEITLLRIGKRSLSFVPFSSSSVSQMETAPSWLPSANTFVFAMGYEDGGPAPSCNTETTGGEHDTKVIKGGCDHPAVAPDGTSILYDHDSGVWSAGIDGSNPTLVMADASRPSWAPNGKRIAFVSGGAVYVSSPTGADRRQLAPRGSDPVWSPDGKLIAYAVNRGRMRIDVRPAGGGAPRQLFIEPKRSENTFAGMDWQALGG
jgi:Tol biopolymer transport system component